MRINKFLAQNTALSRRGADEAITRGKVTINGRPAKVGDETAGSDRVTLDDQLVLSKTELVTIMLNKPVGYVCSREGQGSQTVYDLLPPELHKLNAVGRLDKDSSGLLLLTNDGALAHQLTHPSFEKQKVYELSLDKPLKPADKQKIEQGVSLDDGISKLGLGEWGGSKPIPNSYFQVIMSEGRNRQIRRTFEALGYKVVSLHRTQFGPYSLGSLSEGKYSITAGRN